jgi:outer membrane protein
MKPIVSFCFGMLFFHGAAFSQSTREKIGYADVDYIFRQLPEAKQIEAELKSLQVQLEGQLKTKYEEFRKKYEMYVTIQKTAATAELQNKEKELQLMQENLQKFEQECQGTLQRKQKQLIDPVTRSIQKAISAVAGESGYGFILNAGADQDDVILFAVDHADISNLVLQKLGVQAPAGSRR